MMAVGVGVGRVLSTVLILVAMAVGVGVGRVLSTVLILVSMMSTSKFSSSDEFFMCVRCRFEWELRRLFATAGTRSTRVFRNSRLNY